MKFVNRNSIIYILLEYIYVNMLTTLSFHGTWIQSTHRISDSDCPELHIHKPWVHISYFAWEKKSTIRLQAEPSSTIKSTTFRQINKSKCLFSFFLWLYLLNPKKGSISKFQRYRSGLTVFMSCMRWWRVVNLLVYIRQICGFQGICKNRYVSHAKISVCNMGHMLIDVCSIDRYDTTRGYTVSQCRM